jgi:hypothetical protein
MEDPRYHFLFALTQQGEWESGSLKVPPKADSLDHLVTLAQQKSA